MKKIGLIGGTTWHSTIDYYTYINRIVNERLGASHSAELVLHSVDFEEFKTYAEQGKWDLVAHQLVQIANQLQSINVEAIVLCANTTHKVADTVAEKIAIPLLHIADAMGEELIKINAKTTGLIGTIYTMQSEFMPEKLKHKGINAIVPEFMDMQLLNEIIFEELAKGIFKDETKHKILEIMGKLKNKGADSIILGCTEFPLIIKEPDTDLPLIDSTFAHAKYIVDYALKSID